VIFSFNENRLVTVWSGFSTKWYGELFSDPQMLGAAWLSLQIAFLSASIALVLGTLCAVALVRFRRFRGKTVLQATVSAPLVMPDVITGLALLLLFVAMQSTDRLAGRPRHPHHHHRPFTFCMAYVTVVVQSRLSDLDLSLEEAAMDLGATPVRVFFDITLPIIAPALSRAGCWPSPCRSTTW
jgi:putrescine transport system permease protein